MKLSGIKYLTDQGIENIWKNKMMAFATFCVLLISLMLVGVSALFYVNINSIIDGLGDKNEIAVFINKGTTQERVDQFGQELLALDNVDGVDFISRGQALDNMISSMPEYEVLFESLNGDNPLPDGYSVRVGDLDKVSETVTAISNMPDVYLVRASYDFVEILREMRRIVTIIASAIMVALVIVSMIMISNTTKASVFARREEIQIMKYVGATNAFIRTPFFVEGMVTGLFAGVGAFLLTWLGYNAVADVLTQQVGVMNVIGMGSIIPFNTIRLYVLIFYILCGSFIGALGSVISTRKHINV
ncbi:MAG: permease-like cell division protein FtsX [Ruminococcus sp.]|nr:permease-like cell division protein FtsX [Ruminococcus sp.]